MTELFASPVDNELLFSDEIEPLEPLALLSPWKLLIVDDDPEIHEITNLVLTDFTFEKRPIQFFHAYSDQEARQLIDEHPDTAIILLDVVMEADDSGLQFVKHIRNTLSNKFVRIILRTGQPGQAPEREVIENYDINDYKEKTELTAQKLVTAMMSSLRSYAGILTIAKLNDELEEKVRQRTAELEESLNIIKQDEEAGKKIQFKLLPPQTKEFEEYTFSHSIIPSLYMSGDFLDYFRVNSHYIGFYIADVAGHGTSSAFITILLKSFISNYLEKYESEKNDLIISPARLLKKLNWTLIEDNLGKHLTLFYGLINLKENTLTYANGGQYPFPILYDLKDSSELNQKGFPVGLLEFTMFEQQTIQLPESFSLLFLSDGVLDLINAPDHMEVLHQFAKTNGASIKSIKELLEVDDTGHYPDDLTFLMLKKGDIK